MNKIFSIFTLIILMAGCQTSNKKKEKAHPDTVEQIKLQSIYELGTLSWSDSLLKLYINFADNSSIKQARKANYYEDWIYDNTLNTDSAEYDIYRIGHDVPKQDYSDTIFVVDQWVYIDTKRQQLYEYDAAGKKLTRW